MLNNWLSKEHRFLGRIKIGHERHLAIIIVQPDLELHVFTPLFNPADEGIPEFAKGELIDWNIEAKRIAGKISYRHDSFNSIKNKLGLKRNEINYFSQKQKKMLWKELTYRPDTITFTRIGSDTVIPDEWGITYYPEKNSNRLFHLFANNRNPRNLPNIFSAVDKGHYFINSEQWTLESIQARLKLLVPCLSLFVAAPISYELLIGRYEKKVLCIQFKNEPNPNAYICPSPYNGCVDIKKNAVTMSPALLIRRIEELHKSANREKTLTLLNYFRILFMSFFKEAKIAFSFQLMESLAKYKGIKFKNSPKFDEYIGRALTAIKQDDSFKINPSSIKSIAAKYRNEVFHGNFFETMTDAEKIIDIFPKSYRRDLPLIFQAIATMIGINFLLGIDFSEMIAIKREM